MESESLLIRIFLAMLNFDKFYQDYGIQYNSEGELSKWINFKDVCTKVGIQVFPMRIQKTDSIW